MMRNNDPLNLSFINYRLMKKKLILILVLFAQHTCFAQNDAARIDTLLNAYYRLSRSRGSCPTNQNPVTRCGFDYYR